MFHHHLPRALSLALAFVYPLLIAATLTYGVVQQGVEARHGAKVACRAARNSDLGLVRGLSNFLETGPRKVDPETHRFLVFLRMNADAVYDGCIRDIH